MKKPSKPRDNAGVCMDCHCYLTDDNAYDDTICTSCYIAELEGEDDDEKAE